MAIDLTDEQLFGNDAGDDEDERLLNHYFLERREFVRFYDVGSTLRIVKARKGTGKSALLKRTVTKAREQRPDDLFVTCKGPEISPDFSNPQSSANPVLAWQRSICARINREIGARIKAAFTDDEISLVEAAEIDSFRGRNLFSALSDRLLKKISLGGVAELERQRLPIGDEVRLLTRFSSGEAINVWFIVDDIDATFKNSEENKRQLAAFFSACRDLCQKVKGLTIRAAVRTDVWTLLRGADEALDKCDQYVFNLRWSVSEVAYILVSKIDAYFRFLAPEQHTIVPANEEARKAQAFMSVFSQKYRWGRDGAIDSQKYIAIYSQGRPRWSAKLCRAAAKLANSRGHLKIDEPDVRSALPAYSAQRRLDLVGEHSQEYGEFNVLLQVFSGWNRRFTTQEMLTRISTDHIKKSTSQEARQSDAVNLAHLLFRSGAITAVNKTGGAKAQRYDYEDRPTLLTSRAELDEGCDWEVPMFLRDALKLS